MTLVLVMLGAWVALSTLFALLLGPAMRTSGSSGSTAVGQRDTASREERVPALGGAG